MEEKVTGSFSPGLIGEAVRVMRSGGIAVLPTDTLYGLHCLASDIAAIEKIIDLKGRKGETGFILLASDISMVDEVVSEWPDDYRGRLDEIWPAPLTAVLPAGSKVIPLLSPKGKVAVRVPSLGPLRQLIRILGETIVSTSVNRSGRPPLRRIADIRKEFRGLDIYISMRGRRSDLPSTIVDCSKVPSVVVRKGRCRAWNFGEK
ncbi:MAG: threonylcarbamoyl-AMP synthase [Candidatus Krumholzibacteriota bacterium]|nr:threonylcarbamoyl-AMP synthase [Candidatus Krumholzibacteriota bacterium]